MNSRWQFDTQATGSWIVRLSKAQPFRCRNRREHGDMGSVTLDVFQKVLDSLSAKKNPGLVGCVVLFQRTMELGREVVRRRARRTLLLRPRDG